MYHMFGSSVDGMWGGDADCGILLLSLLSCTLWDIWPKWYMQIPWISLGTEEVG